jgi:hypothetical protein
MAPATYLMEPPEGQVRTLVNPPSSGGGVLPCGVATTAIAFIVVSLRIFTRKFVVKSVLGIDDCKSIRFIGSEEKLTELSRSMHSWYVLLVYLPWYLLNTYVTSPSQLTRPAYLTPNSPQPWCREPHVGHHS